VSSTPKFITLIPPPHTPIIFMAQRHNENETTQKSIPRGRAQCAKSAKPMEEEKEGRTTARESVFGRTTCLDAVLLYFEIESFRGNAEDLSGLESVPLVGLQDFLNVDFLYFFKREKTPLMFG